MDLIPALSSATNQQETFNRPVTQVGLMSTNEAAKRQEEAFVPVTPSVLVAGHPYYITKLYLLLYGLADLEQSISREP